MYTRLTIGHSNKGRRIWLTATGRYGFAGNTRYNITYGPDAITIVKDSEGARAVTATAGGVIDLQNKKVTMFAKEAQDCNVLYAGDTITITRV